MQIMVGLLVFSAVAVADVYVATDGDDSDPGTQAKPVLTLGRAVALAKTASTIHVNRGLYRLSAPLVLTSENSGLLFVATGAVAISGGVAVGPWTATTAAQTAGPTAGLVTAKLPAPASFGGTRQLFVNGLRSPRARLDGGVAGKVFANAKLEDFGYSIQAGIDTAPIRHGAEFVFPQSTSPWTEPRCAVDNVTATAINMMQPCWTNLVHKACGQHVGGTPVGRGGYVENVAPAYITAAGEWSVDPATSEVHYMLRPGESASTLAAELPVLEVLVNITGASAVSFTGFGFMHATWLRPGQGDGFVEQQTGCCAIGTSPDNHLCTAAADRHWSIKSPGNVVLDAAKDITFTQCEFTQFGGAGLDLTATTGSVVDSCYFHDISGAAVQIGRFDDPLSGVETVDNVVVNTIVNKAGAEYSGAAGINVGYTQNTSLLHNDVSNMSYTPISVGWGWSRHTCASCTNAANNTIAYNRCHDYKQVLNDGGGIYMLGPQNGSKIHDNYVYDQGTPSSGALYPDEGSAYSTWSNNVVTGIGRSEWLHLWTASIHNITVADNFADTKTFLNHGTNCPMIDNTVFPPGSPPPAAVAIMNASGVSKANPWAPTLRA